MKLLIRDSEHSDHDKHADSEDEGEGRDEGETLPDKDNRDNTGRGDMSNTNANEPGSCGSCTICLLYLLGTLKPNNPLVDGASRKQGQLETYRVQALWSSRNQLNSHAPVNPIFREWETVDIVPSQQL
ncbi:hypothetical protein DL96DRAFT_1565003 [Flagelloscypha sp. PMI_526]|nr:hypothetical protein DL96DRAFT_1565003 [Flagelloscypha sp. PMI_526]